MELPRDDIPFSSQQFADHLAWLGELCPDRPLGPHTSDLYLAGAAGHRVPKAWEVVEHDVGPSVQRMAHGRALAGMDVEELWSLARSKLMSPHRQRPELARIAEYRGLVTLASYALTAALRLAISEHRRKRPTVEADLARQGDAERGSDVLPGATHDDPPADGQAIRRMVEDGLVRALAGVTPSQRALLQLVARGVTQRDAARMLGWHESKVSRALSDARGQLASVVLELSDAGWPPQAKRAIARALQDWLQDGERQGETIVQARSARASGGAP